MKLIQKHQTKEFKNSNVCTAIEYPLQDKDINATIIKLNGRYPDKGRVVNEVCKELVYVIDGLGKLFIEDTEYNLQKEDVLLIDKGEKYYWEGDLTLFVSCTPAWYPEQHKTTE